MMIEMMEVSRTGELLILHLAGHQFIDYCDRHTNPFDQLSTLALNDVRKSTDKNHHSGINSSSFNRSSSSSIL